MARIRTIKPEFFTSLTIDALSLEQRLTFIGLWTYCDDDGRCKYDPRLIRAALWPLSERSPDDVADDIRGLSEASLITHYVVGERSFLAVNGWREHQRINRRTPSKVPGPDSGEIRPLTSKNESSRRTHGGRSEDAPRERKGTGNREGKPDAGASGASEPPTDPEEINPRTIVGAWVEAMDVVPSQGQRNQVGKLAKELLAHNDPTRVLAAARAAGAKGFATIDRELTAMAARPLRALAGGRAMPFGYDEHGQMRDPKSGVLIER